VSQVQLHDGFVLLGEASVVQWGSKELVPRGWIASRCKHFLDNAMVTLFDCYVERFQFRLVSGYWLITLAILYSATR
jgi:hypothetical protein